MFYALDGDKEPFVLTTGEKKAKGFAVPREKEMGFMQLPNQKTFMPLGRAAVMARKVFEEEESQPAFKMSPKQKPVRNRDEAALAWPIAKDTQQWISSPFGWRDDPFTQEQAFHAGLDIAVPEGTPVRAAAAGTVTGVGEHPRLGRYVKVSHADDPETYSLYGHLKLWHVKEGDVVRMGEKIAEVGMTGRTTGAHLDYSLRRKGKPVDPMQHLDVPSQLKKLEVSSR